MDQRRQKLENRIAAFLRKYGRKAPKKGEPNDRRFDRKVQQMIRRMKPGELDELIRRADEVEEYVYEIRDGLIRSMEIRKRDR